MAKDFNAWNENKQQIHAKGENKLYQAREVWWCSLGVNIGFEQDGTGDKGERPVVILKGFSRSVCLAIPLTSSEKKNPYHFSLGKIEGRNSFAIVSQIRLIDTKRLINKVAVVPSLESTEFDNQRDNENTVHPKSIPLNRMLRFDSNQSRLQKTGSTRAPFKEKALTPLQIRAAAQGSFR